MIRDDTEGRLDAAREFSSLRSIEVCDELERLLAMLKDYYYSDVETDTIIENTNKPNEFFVVVRRVTGKGPRLLDTLTLRYNKPEVVLADGVVRPKDPYPTGWLLLSSGTVVKESPHRRTHV